MKHVNVEGAPYFQGDLMIMKIKKIPHMAIAIEKEPTGGNWILAHSESGHHHVIDSRSAQMLIDKTNEFIAWIEVAEPTVLRHLRDWDTHEPYMLPPGRYEVRRQRESSPEGWRGVAD